MTKKDFPKTTTFYSSMRYTESSVPAQEDMVKDIRKSHGTPCLGVYRSAQKCTLARDKSGNAVVLNRLCDKCNEQRWRAHCKCKRTGVARGQRAARGVASISQATSPPAVVGFVGRAPATKKKELTRAWHRSLLVAAPSFDGPAKW